MQLLMLKQFHTLWKEKNWKLPQLTFNQVEDIISRLRTNKSPDIKGFSAKHLKNGGPIAVYFIMKYLNKSFQSIQYGVPESELTGIASMIHKGNKKSLINPKSFRKITVCALLGEIKQMAVCDLIFPFICPFKPSSQLGFTPGLFVKLANVIVTEKRAFALYHNVVVLHQFLDAWRPLTNENIQSCYHSCIMQECMTISLTTSNKYTVELKHISNGMA